MGDIQPLGVNPLKVSQFVGVMCESVRCDLPFLFTFLSLVGLSLMSVPQSSFFSWHMGGGVLADGSLFEWCCYGVQGRSPFSLPSLLLFITATVLSKLREVRRMLYCDYVLHAVLVRSLLLLLIPLYRCASHLLIPLFFLLPDVTFHAILNPSPRLLGTPEWPPSFSSVFQILLFLLLLFHR